MEVINGGVINCEKIDDSKQYNPGYTITTDPTSQSILKSYNDLQNCMLVKMLQDRFDTSTFHTNVNDIPKYNQDVYLTNLTDTQYTSDNIKKKVVFYFYIYNNMFNRINRIAIQTKHRYVSSSSEFTINKLITQWSMTSDIDQVCSAISEIPDETTLIELSNDLQKSLQLYEYGEVGDSAAKLGDAKSITSVLGTPEETKDIDNIRETMDINSIVGITKSVNRIIQDVQNVGWFCQTLSNSVDYVYSMDL